MIIVNGVITLKKTSAIAQLTQISFRDFYCKVKEHCRNSANRFLTTVTYFETDQTKPATNGEMRL